ncbi:MAG TPA: metallophosphoesterase [bacterium]|nr:metallophosphoesterase [bacterium]HPR86779.1 metallophosphoesterase [bacterium]
MKHSGFIIFLSVALSIYTLMNWYLLRRGLHALPAHGWPRTLFTILILLLAAAYPLGRWWERSIGPRFADVLVHIGAYYSGMLILALVVLIFIDLIWLANHFFAFVPPGWRGPHTAESLKLFWFTAALVAGLTLAGAINARYPRVRHLALEIAKPAPVGQLRLLLATDIHLGTLIHNSRLQELVAQINAQMPDLILLGGDLFDEDVLSLSRQNMAGVLQQLTARHGVYAIPGNHEYFSGIDQALDYMRNAGITVLRDRTLKAADAVWLIGRDDRQGNMFGRQRRDLAELLAAADKSQPLILLDHQPFHLEEAENQGIDLQLSGHTHHGQLFPFQYITKALYEKSWGYLRKGHTQYYVSCGAGTWGPPLRLGNRPEIVVIDLTFTPAP